MKIAEKQVGKVFKGLGIAFAPACHISLVGVTQYNIVASYRCSFEKKIDFLLKFPLAHTEKQQNSVGYQLLIFVEKCCL